MKIIEKLTGVIVLLILGLILYPREKSETIKSVVLEEEEEYMDEINKALQDTLLMEKYGQIVTATVYNPTKDQCDSDPLITADNSKIDLQQLNSGQLKWIAVSRDLREKYKYGDKVMIFGHPDINGIYEVRDTMNPKWTKRIDILRPIGNTKGKYVNIKIVKYQ